jgi:hypothetical protein
MIQGGMEGWAMPSAVSCERTIRLRSFGRWPAVQRTSTRAGGCCRWLRRGREWIADRRPRSAGWIARRCATGSIGSTPPGRTGSSTTGQKARSRACQPSNSPSWRPSSRPTGSRERRRRALAPGRPQARHRGAVRRRLPRALRRQASQEARLLAHERKASPSGPGRADCRGV